MSTAQQLTGAAVAGHLSRLLGWRRVCWAGDRLGFGRRQLGLGGDAGAGHHGDSDHHGDRHRNRNRDSARRYGDRPQGDGDGNQDRAGAHENQNGDRSAAGAPHHDSAQASH